MASIHSPVMEPSFPSLCVAQRRRTPSVPWSGWTSELRDGLADVEPDHLVAALHHQGAHGVNEPAEGDARVGERGLGDRANVVALRAFAGNVGDRGGDRAEAAVGAALEPPPDLEVHARYERRSTATFDLPESSGKRVQEKRTRCPCAE